ncbi:efflux RND transporter permease subunit [Candidatus Sumerlaeota bacterium]|nr:efflux RND transporter permease subunit [Candidatus Sumerlaeota bacterium]
MIRFFAAHPTAANLLMAAFIILGVFSLPSLRRETFPDFSADLVEVRVIYPGATAEDVEEAICQRIEDAIEDVNHIEEVISEAREGVGIVTIEMAERGDFSIFLDDINTEVDAIDDFPDLSERPVIRALNRTDAVVAVAVTGDMALPDLKAYCEDLKTRLQREAGVSLVDVTGFSEHQIRIEIPSTAAMQHGLSIEDIAAVITAQSLDLPSGAIETSDREIVVRFTEERTNPREFEDLVIIGGQSGGEVRLGDIATISDVFELDEARILFNGRRAGLLQVSKTKSEDTLSVFHAVREFVEREREMAPPGVELTLTQDISSIVSDRLSMLVENGIMGLILVFAVLWLFFGLRFSVWVAMGLPVSFLGAFFFFPMLGISINMISMVGLLLGIGLLMDDAIVISENIASHLGRRQSVLESVLDGVMEVRWGVVSSFATTVMVFSAALSVEGNIGKLLRAMPLVLILVLAVSLVEAFLILPHHLIHSLHGQTQVRRGRFDEWIERVISHCREGVERIATRTVRWRYLTLGVTVMIFLLSLAVVAGGFVKFQAFPEIDGDVVQAQVLLPQGTPLERTEQITERLTAAMERVNEALRPRQPEGMDLVRNISVQFNVNRDAAEQGPHVATVSVDLLTAEQRDGRVDEILNMWREEMGEVTDVISLKFGEPQIGPQGRAIDIRLHGDDLVELNTVAHEIADWLRDFVGVHDISTDLRPGKPELRIRLREGAINVGLTARSIALQLRSALYGTTASEIQVGSESYEIDVRLAEADRDTWADLEYLRIELPGGGQAPLGAMTTIEPGRSWARIMRIDGRRTVSVQADLDSLVTNTREVVMTFRRELLPQVLAEHPGISVTLSGEVEEGGTTMTSLLRGLLIGVIGVFILLSFQFRSYIEPIIVMVAIPFCLIGVIWGHLIMGLNLSLPSVFGFVSLAGVVVNDSLLLVLFIKNRRREGLRVQEAAPRAARERFRAVLLTSLTTIAGLTPLLFEKSLQAQILIPLCTSLVFGLLASTVLVLLVLPALYAILEDLGLTAKIE